MKSNKNWQLTWIFAAIVAVLLGFSIAAQAQVLVRKNVSEDELMNMIMRGSVRGRITEVSYVQDQGSGFLLDVSFEGYKKHSQLSFAGQLKKNDRTVGRIVVEDHELGSEDGQIRIALKFENANLQESIEADSLVLTVNKGRPRQNYTFRFDKSWGTGTGTPTGASNSNDIDPWRDTASSDIQDEPVTLVKIKPIRVNPEPVKFLRL